MDHDLLIQQLCGVTNASEEEARHLLEAFHWNLEEAIQAHFDADQEEVHPPHDTIESQFVSGPKVVAPTNKIVTFESIRNNQQDDPEDGQAFYVGGSETGGGGQQVLGPSKKTDRIPDPNVSPDEFVHSLFQAAKGQGAEVLDTERYQSSSEKSTKKPVPFSGAGYKLGEDPHGPSVIEPTSVARRPESGACNSSEQPSSSEEKRVIVKMWRDGFSLDDGPLRSYTDPGSQSFLEDIKAGRVPQELLRCVTGGLVNVLLEDHHHETWRGPLPPKVVPFSGKGNMLGHPVPRLITNSSLRDPVSTTPIVAPSINDAEPATQLQIRLPDGGRLLVRLNHSHTIGDVRQAILSQRPNLASSPFALMTSYPSRELKDEGQSLVDANLLNSALLIRLI